MLAPSEDPAAAAQVFHAQEAAFLKTRDAIPQDGGGDGDRPLTGAKPPSVASGVVAEEDRPLTGGGGGSGRGKGAWVPPSEFPPGHEEGLASASGGGVPGPDDDRPLPAVEGGGGGTTETAGYMTALG